METFVSKCLNGSADPSEIDNYIDMWHNKYCGAMSLNDFLGMSKDDYQKWALNPEYIVILTANKNGKPKT